MLTNDEFKIMLNRTYKKTPDYSAISRFKVGTDQIDPTITDTDLTNPIPIGSTIVVSDFDSVTDWNTTTDGDITTNDTTYKKASYSLNLIKDATTQNNVSYYNEDLNSLDFTQKYVFGWIYIKDSDTLNKLATSNAVEVRYGNDWNTNYYYYRYDRADLSVGWNEVKFNAFYRWIDNWTEIQPAGDSDKNWSDVDAASIGSWPSTRIVFYVYGGRMYHNTDFDDFDTFTEIRPAGDTNYNWSSFCGSSDSTGFMACVYGGRIYFSSDDDLTTWTETQPAGDSNKNWTQVSMNGNGWVATASAYGGRLYRSKDQHIPTSGFNWSETQPAGNTNANWICYKVDSAGSGMLAVAYGGRVYLSTNVGDTWSELQPDGNRNGNWKCADQRRISGSMIVTKRVIVGETNGRLWFSTGPQHSSEDLYYWIELRPLGNTNANWERVKIIDSDTLMVSTDERSFISFNLGTTWIELRPEGDVDAYWKAIEYISDKVFLGEENGRLYTGDVNDNTSEYNATEVGIPDITDCDSLAIKLTFINTSQELSAGDVIGDNFMLFDDTSLYKDLTSDSPIIDEVNFEATNECYINYAEANGFLLNGIGTFNEDDPEKMGNVFKFTPFSKSNTDELIFKIKNRLRRV